MVKKKLSGLTKGFYEKREGIRHPKARLEDCKQRLQSPDKILGIAKTHQGDCERRLQSQER